MSRDKPKSEPRATGAAAVPSSGAKLGTASSGAAIGKRIDEVVKLFSSVGAAAEAAGISLETLDRYRKGETGLKLEPLIRLTGAVGASLQWVATGDGPMMIAAGPIGSSEEIVALPRYDVRASAGQGAMVVSEQLVDWVYFRREWLRHELGVNPGRIAVITATGDSMSPTIEEGDLLLVDVQEKKPSRDGVYVIGVEDTVVVKRVARLRSGALAISSDNPRYSHTAEEVGRADIHSIRFIGRVVWAGGRI